MEQIFGEQGVSADKTLFAPMTTYKQHTVPGEQQPTNQEGHNMGHAPPLRMCNNTAPLFVLVVKHERCRKRNPLVEGHNCHRGGDLPGQYHMLSRAQQKKITKRAYGTDDGGIKEEFGGCYDGRVKYVSYPDLWRILRDISHRTGLLWKRKYIHEDAAVVNTEMNVRKRAG